MALVASSSLPPSWRYHVFLSFRGEDTRTNFTDHLYHALVRKEIKTFIDRHLPKGEEISPTLLKAIEESRISLVILSKNYADSRWCLEELVKIHQCRESKEQIILPVFYKVDPSHVRNQTGCYGAAFIDHERKFQDKEMVLRWRRALTEVANLSGYHVKEEDYESKIIKKIVNDILVRVTDGTYLKASHPKRDSKQQQKILALRSNNNKKYLRYIHQRIENLDGLVQFSEENVKSEYARFQIELADSGYGGLVHIKCCFNNKYLRRANDHQYWIVAGANKPEEDKKHWSCTLFEPVFIHSDNKAVFRLLHVQLGHFVTSFTVNDFNQCLFAERNTPNLHNDMDVYTVVDLEPLVLPSPFVLKSNNNRYLGCMLDQENNIHQILQFSAHDRTSEFAQRANSRDHQKIHALRSNNNKKYLRFIHQRIENLDGLVQFSEEDVKSEYAKFQIEPADSGYGALVHIKCCFNNKYLRRANDHQYWIVAGANEPQEDKKHWSCTLFKPVLVDSDKEAVFRLLHVQLGHFVTSFTINDFNQCLYAGSNTPNLHDDMDVYTVVDLELLVLPRSFALKSNNNKKYLRYIHQRIENLDGLVQLSEEDVKSEYAKFQMEPADSGYGELVHIKCCFNNKYLRRANDHQYWIVAGADEPEEDKKHWSCTLFEPVVVHSDNKAVFRLLHVQLGHFVTSFTVNNFNQCLFAESNTPNLHDDMDVYTVVDLKPLVLPRSNNFINLAILITCISFIVLYMSNNFK